MSKPDASAQFHSPSLTPEEHRRIRAYYFGGCGDGNDFYPERHHWLGSRTWTSKSGQKMRERICKWCGLVSDPEPIQPRKAPK